jgi:hypothetical protein
MVGYKGFAVFFISLLLAVPSRGTDEDFFPVSYTDSRARFLEHVVEIKMKDPTALWRELKVPSQNDDDLFVDYLYLPAKRKTKTLVVLTSGVHGIETFAGAAVQFLFLERYVRSGVLHREDAGYLVVHSLNPYGFKNFRRATENNVNLNRNFSLDPQTFKRQNTSYQQLAPTLEPQGPIVESSLPLMGFSTGIREAVQTQKISTLELLLAVGQGQHSSPKGLEFGGFRPEPQSVDFLSYLRKLGAQYEDIVLLDIHTGLGEKNILHLMPSDEPQAFNQDLFEELFDARENGRTYRYTPTSTNGFYRTYGDSNSALAEIFPSNKRLLGLTLEFGTLGSTVAAQIRTLNTLVLENQYHHFGDANFAAYDIIRNQIDELFYPQEPLWRDSVIQKSRELLSALTRNLRRKYTREAAQVCNSSFK